MGPYHWSASTALSRTLNLIPLGYGNKLRTYNQGHTHSQPTWLKWEEIFEENCLRRSKKEVKEVDGEREVSSESDFRSRDIEIEPF